MKTKSPVREKPIIFTGPMVRAILEGRKRQTRRVVKPQPPLCKGFPREANGEWGIYLDRPNAGPYKHLGRCPFPVGTRLWVRENLRADGKRQWFYSNHKPVLVSTSDELAMVTWAHHKTGMFCPSIHMPRWASRLTLEVTAVRVERLHAISEADAKAEGMEADERVECADGSPCYTLPFERAWRAMYGLDGVAGWDANPWIWCLAFKRIK